MALIQLTDPNLYGAIFFDLEGDAAELRASLTDIMVERAGTWQTLPDTDGVVLLSEPAAHVYLGWSMAEMSAHPEYTDAPYPDAIAYVKDGGLVTERA